nr:sporulation protein YjcZ [Paenibacillus arenilitoris]
MSYGVGGVGAGHCGPGVGGLGTGCSSIGVILVLFILLVIISRAWSF